MSLLLVLEHLGGISLPGCGGEGACARATRSAWGSVPLGGAAWPTAYLGMAYFISAHAAWMVVRRAAPAALRYVARLGMAISLLFVVVMLVTQTFCPYCILAHVGNLGFWLVLELTRARGHQNGRALGVLIGVFLVVTAILGVLDARRRAGAAAEAESARAEAAREMIRRAGQALPASTQPADTAPPTTAAGPAAPGTQAAGGAQPGPATAPAGTAAPIPGGAPAGGASPTTQPAGFTGRFRTGPHDAPIRIVMFTDYQCDDCARIEAQIEQIIAERNDVSVSIKHFPFNAECNPAMTRTLHRNACWAARAAEAAGLLWGDEGYWKMHKWLFARGGEFETQQQLEAGIRELGYDPAGFVQTMASDETLRRVRADCAEAVQLGLFFTPMIFINGVELRGWNAPNAVVTTVAELAAANPPRRTPEVDVPAKAREKLIGDWRDWNEGRPVGLPADPGARSLGPDTATAKVVIWGDYQEPITARVDKTIRAFMAGRDDVQYTYRHFPFNKECNPRASEARFPQACVAAQAAEAAGMLGGVEDYWKMHVWLMENQAQVSVETIRTAAPTLGLDADALIAAMASPQVAGAIRADIEAAAKLPQLRHGMRPGLYGVPTVFVNGKYVLRSEHQGDMVLPDILAEAAAQ